MSRSGTITLPPPLQSKILTLIDEFKLYEPESETYDEYRKLIVRRLLRNVYRIQVINKFHGNNEYKNIKDYIHLLVELRDLKLKKYKDKLLPEGQKKITDFYKPIKNKSSSIPATISTSISASTSHPELKKRDICAERYLEKSIREHKERQRIQQEHREWRKTIDERNKQIQKRRIFKHNKRIRLCCDGRRTRRR